MVLMSREDRRRSVSFEEAFRLGATSGRCSVWHSAVYDPPSNGDDDMTNTPRLYVIGASCSGVSTLGAMLSEQFAVPLLDVDDFYWMPTDPPFTTKRPPEDRVRLIKEQQAQSKGWVLSGSFIGWGDTLIENVDLIGSYIRIRLYGYSASTGERRYGMAIVSCPAGTCMRDIWHSGTGRLTTIHPRSLGAIWSSITIGSMHNPLRCLDLTEKRTPRRWLKQSRPRFLTSEVTKPEQSRCANCGRKDAPERPQE